MGVDLLKHNQEAFYEINKMIESGIRKIAVPRATGSGKTYLMGALAEQYNNDKKLVLEPTRPLLNSIKEKFDEFGITNTDFITYQKLIRMSDEDIAAMDYKLIFLDECHHGTAPIWGQKIDCLINTHLDSIVFGTSATTVRNDGVNIVESLFEGIAIGELPLSTAIARKILPCPHYITAIYRLDDEFEKLKKRIESATNTKSEKKEFYKKMKTMKLHFEKSYGVPLILNKYIKVRNGRYLVFCKDKKHLDAMRDVVINWFYTAGIKDIHSYAVYSDYPDKEKDYKDFQEDNSDALKILFSINMLNEGVHIKDISGVLMLRTTQSILIYLQQLGRLVEAENMDKYLLVFDFVNNFSSVNDGISLLKEIKDAIAREKESNPNFDDSGFEDIDTFFVIDQVLEIKEMFHEIEGRLKGREWTEEENEILKNWYQIEGTEVRARLKGRTKVAIKAQAKKLGLSINSCKPWAEDEIEILKKYYPIEGLEVVDRLDGRTKSSIVTKAYKLDIKAPDNSWTNEEIEILKRYYPVEGIEVESKLNKKTRSSIQTMTYLLNIKKIGRVWTEEEVEILKKYYPIEGLKVEDRLDNKSKYSIKNKAKSLGIKCVKSIFTKREDEIIKLYYPKEGNKVCKRLNGKTEIQCRSRASYLNVNSLKDTWTDKEYEILKEYYPKIGSEVSVMLNKSNTACSIMASRLGIKRERKNQYRYVYRNGNKYVVQFVIDGKRLRFGSFDTEDEAAKVAMQKAIEFGKAI